MQVILLERIENLGQMGETVKVRNGYARNYLLPQNKAMRATKENLAHFEKEKATLEAANLKKKKEAEKAAGKINGTEITLIRQASENGQLYGSVRSHDIREALMEQKIEVEKNQIVLSTPIKNTGVSQIRIRLHPEVDATITLNIARSEDDAQVQMAGDPSLVQAVEAEAPAAEEEVTHKPKKAKKSKAKAAADEESQQSTEDDSEEDAA